MSSAFCELVHRQKKKKKMRTSKIDRNHAVFIERTREGDQFYSILATRSSSDSDARGQTMSHRKQKRRHGSLGSIWRTIFLAGSFFMALVLMATMSWLVISMKFRLETLEVKVIRLCNDVDSLLRTQLTWTSTQTTINSLTEQIHNIKGDMDKTDESEMSTTEDQYIQITDALQEIRLKIQGLETELKSVKVSMNAQNIWSMISDDSQILCQIRDDCSSNAAVKDDS